MKNYEKLSLEHRYACGIQELNEMCINDYNIRNQCIWLFCATILKKCNYTYYMYCLKMTKVYEKKMKLINQFNEDFVEKVLKDYILTDEQAKQLKEIDQYTSSKPYMIRQYIIMIDHYDWFPKINYEPIFTHLNFIIENGKQFNMNVAKEREKMKMKMNDEKDKDIKPNLRTNIRL
jgi:hypothetical protein